jgi:Raf kinase inhibitor-like YbhB/YbcL family protein
MRLGNVIAVLFAGLAPCSALAATTAGLAIADPGLKAAKTLTVASPKIAPGGRIPEVYSAYGKGVSPPLSWGKGPYGARSFALVVEDPDAPMPTPFVHWMVWDIPATVAGTQEGLAPAGAQQGRLLTGTTGYMGPRPPAGGPHHYHFQVFALDRPLGLKAGAERAALVGAMKGHVLASGELVGVYQKK